jgi:Flp pilus assembly protein TadG
MAETALITPVFLLILGACFTGSQMLSAVISLDGAARAGVIAYVSEHDETVDSDGDGDVINKQPPSPAIQLTDATAAVNNEEGLPIDARGCSSGTPSNSFVCVADQAHCTSGHNCVWVTEDAGTRQGHKIEVIHVAKFVASYLPLLGDHTVTAQAGLEP